MSNEQNLKSWAKGQSGNLKGRPKGSKNLSTYIRELMEDENFKTYLHDPKIGYREYTGTPVVAIVQTAITKAVHGDNKARDWLAKYGWGHKIEQEQSGYQTIVIEASKTESFKRAAEFAEFIKQRTKLR